VENKKSIKSQKKFVMPLNIRNYLGSPEEGHKYILRRKKKKELKIHVKSKVTQKQDDNIVPTVFGHRGEKQ